MTAENKSRIFRLSLASDLEGGNDERLGGERMAALSDLMQNHRFQPLNDNNGPYALRLSIQESKLVLHLRNILDEDILTLVLSLRPYRRLIQDYFLMLESYERARHSATREKLEAIDMGRRGLHNEGAELLVSRLKDKIDMDFDMARRLFTLICALHKNNVLLL